MTEPPPHPNQTHPLFSAVILGGDRSTGNPPVDPLVRAAGAPCKALVPIGGIPMVLRVVAALRQSAWIGECLLCGPPRETWQDRPELQRAFATGSCRWLEHAATPSTSAARAMREIPRDRPVLITTADHALLRGAIIDDFCSQAQARGCDVVVALARHQDVTAAFPGVRRTALRFRDAAYSGCNLFAILTPAGRRIADFWVRVENQRKTPFRVVSAAGWSAVLRYLLRRLTLEEGLHRLSRRLDLRIGAVILSHPEAAVDVDTVQDWQLVETIAARRKTS